MDDLIELGGFPELIAVIMMLCAVAAFMSTADRCRYPQSLAYGKPVSQAYMGFLCSAAWCSQFLASCASIFSRSRSTTS